MVNCDFVHKRYTPVELLPVGTTEVTSDSFVVGPGETVLLCLKCPERDPFPPKALGAHVQRANGGGSWTTVAILNAALPCATWTNPTATEQLMRVKRFAHRIGFGVDKEV